MGIGGNDSSRITRIVLREVGFMRLDRVGGKSWPRNISWAKCRRLSFLNCPLKYRGRMYAVS